MTLPVKVCRAASATVIRGPPSHRGRGPTLLPLGLFRKKKWFRFKEIARIFRSQHIWLLGKEAIFQCTTIAYLMKTCITSRGFLIESKIGLDHREPPWENSWASQPNNGRLLRLDWDNRGKSSILSGLNLIPPVLISSRNTIKATPCNFYWAAATVAKFDGN